MRRTLPVLITATVLLAACGASDSEPATAPETSPTTETTPSTETAEETATTEGGATDAAPADEPAAESEAEPPATEDPGAADPDIGPPPTNPDKPSDIAFPGVAPEQLEVTVLEEGTGPLAELGDTVIVDYIGVRSLDGVEFDNSYDRFTPFPVGPLGEASVIQGWNDGLVGAQTGARLQLDIPSDQAYGEAARSEVIRENEPLTFVIDVRAVITASDPADQPTEVGVELVEEGVTEIVTVDLVDGEGAVLEDGQTAVFNLVLFRGDNGVALDSTWGSEPIQIPMAEGGFAGLVEGMPGMAVGGRRAIIIPPDKGFGPEGNPPIGLPAATDVIIVVDLLGLY